jgi:hypothetical protein
MAISDKRLEHRYWLSVLRGAERELEAARLRSDLNHAARRLMDAKRELAHLGVDWRAHLHAIGAASASAAQ